MDLKGGLAVQWGMVVLEGYLYCLARLLWCQCNGVVFAVRDAGMVSYWTGCSRMTSSASMGDFWQLKILGYNGSTQSCTVKISGVSPC